MSANKRALVVIDVQGDHFEGSMSIEYPPVDESLPNILSTVKTASRCDIPIAVVQHSEDAGFPVFATGSTGWALHPELLEIVQRTHAPKPNSQAEPYATQRSCSSTAPSPIRSSRRMTPVAASRLTLRPAG